MAAHGSLEPFVLVRVQVGELGAGAVALAAAASGESTREWSISHGTIRRHHPRRGRGHTHAFAHPEGAAHKAIRQALGGAYFSFHNSQQLQGKMVLGEDSYGHSGDKYFWPLSYSSAKTAQKRMDKLEKAGIRCKLTGYNGGCIEFLGYTPETEALLEQERQEGLDPITDALNMDSTAL